MPPTCRSRRARRPDSRTTDARALGAALAGTFSVDPSLLEDIGAVLGGLQIDATRIHRSGPLPADRSDELEIRARHAVTVVAVLQGSLADVAPGPDTVLQPGSRVVVIGRPADVEDFLAGRRRTWHLT